MKPIDPVALALALGIFSLIPLILVTCSSFLKIAIVLSLVRNALGVQQAPPNMAIYALALLLTAYVMAPVAVKIGDIANTQPDSSFSVKSMLSLGRKAGFLLFLPFVVIDLVISNILMAMGMMMVSPVTISLPLKLFLFVMIDGWSRLIHGLVQTYI
jgi:type III secretion protein R